jgi:probable rRNA maturation factor
MIDVEVFGAGAASLPAVGEIERLCVAAAASAGVHDGHLAVQFVDARRIAALNAEHRNEPRPTDVLSFPIDGLERDSAPGAHAPERELGDVVICPAHTIDVREALVHGVLHLMGMDHETDDGEMLALQREVLARAERAVDTGL